ncbi:MAG: hypothetical protein KGL35_12290 [Bradyrhizobium sp.]|nr:hypothetical protein [Bradyrhizobium sp.]
MLGVAIYVIVYGYPPNDPAIAAGRIIGGGLTIALLVWIVLTIGTSVIRKIRG